MRKIGVGIVGFGTRGRSLDVPIRERFGAEAFVVGYCDINERRRKAAMEWVRAYNGIATSDLDDFLARPEIDLVLVCTPQFAHADPVVKALEAGKHVFVEKPMATTLEDCDRMIEARDRSGKNLFMGFNLRNHPICREIKRLVSEGAVGKPQTIVCTDFYAHGGTYFRRWHRFEKNSGGLIVEKGTHSIDLITWYMAAKPMAVASFGGLNVFVPRPDAAARCRECKLASECSYAVDITAPSMKIEELGHDAETLDLCVYNSEKDTCDNHMAIIEYDNGCRASYIESFVSLVPETHGRQFILNGPKGQIWAHLSDRTIRVYRTGAISERHRPVTETRFPEPVGNHGGADDQQIRHILDVLSGRCETHLHAEIGREAVLVALAAETAMKERRVVDVRHGRLE